MPPDTDKLLRWVIAAGLAVASAALWWPAPTQAAVRIKEVAAVQGVRSNQLVGYGLIVGLDGTGDQSTQTPFTTQSLNAMLQQMGVTLPPGVTMQPRNVAAVMVTAQLPPFAQPGQTIDVNVSSVGNAKSLRGGTLIATPLKGADGQIYALAQGNLIVGGAGAAANGSKVQINHLSAGRIPDGASVERAVETPLLQGDSLQLGLVAHDFNTARSAAEERRPLRAGEEGHRGHVPEEGQRLTHEHDDDAHGDQRGRRRRPEQRGPDDLLPDVPGPPEGEGRGVPCHVVHSRAGFFVTWTRPRRPTASPCPRRTRRG